MIRGYVGWVGAGKTASMVRDAVEKFRKERVQVFTNMTGLKIPGAIYVEDLEAITRCGSGLVLLDEAGVFLSSRYWQQVPRSVLMALAQSRKNGLDLYWTSQHEARVDTVLRELSMEVVRCRRFGRYTLQVAYDPVAKERLSRRVIKLRPEYLELYDTLEIISTDGGGGKRGMAALPTSVPGAVLRVSAGSARSPEAVKSPSWARPAVRWYDRRGALTKEAREALWWLREQGVLPEGYPHWLRVVTVELERRAWLRLFDLGPEDVPSSMRPDNPWADGWSPWEVEERRKKEEREGVVAGRK